MNDRIRRLYEMFSRVLNFMTASAADFQAVPFVAATVADLQTETAKVSALAADKVQTTATAKDSTISRGDARDAQREAMEDIADVWKSVTTDDTETANKFRMPRGGNDQNMIATARAFAVEAEANKQVFLDRGMPADFIADLKTKTDAFEQSVGVAHATRGERVGTNAAFDEPVRKCKNLVASLEPVVKRTYRRNPQKMAEWMVASHIAQARKTAQPNPQTNGGEQPKS